MCGKSSGFCCPVSCSSEFFPKKELIAIKRCTPFSALCGESADIFAASSTVASNKLASGVISVINTGSECEMTVDVTDDAGLVGYTVAPGSSVVVEVDNLTLVTITCAGADPTDLCTGTFEADLQYTVIQS